MEQVSVSVHIVTYNSRLDIDACLQAVFRQTYPIGRIIVVDNASTDGTREKLNAYGDRLQLIYNDVNVGFAAAHNQAIRLSKSCFCLILNPDVILHPDYVRLLVEIAQENPDVGSLTGLLLSRSEPGIVDSAGLTITKARRAYDRGQGEHVSRFSAVAEVFGVSGAAALYSRRMIDEISMDEQFFDEAFFAYKEDVDVAWRARLAGWSAFYVPSATASHERGWKKGARHNRPVRIRRHSFENRYRMMIKNDRFSYFLRHLPKIAGAELAMLGFILLREWSLLPSFWRLFRQLPGLLHQRKLLNERISPKQEDLRRLYSFFI